MLICRVIGHVWATKKQEALNGQKLMIVKETVTDKNKGDIFVAADTVGAGVGEDVLVVTGSTARRAAGTESIPVDSAIVGIIDSMEVMKEKK
ncbi:EutN/CcmL family microcompartment protein [Frisingicoccus sp.]|uniref:EutN/CcmL family microcompartment protein n=1 Tax=Frisingicoccus sp. TaxID=1918627 RepID=UPI002A7EF3F0|nr:EutN/CcmL family microcompartment protein [Frisingicoccus sp.]MDY4835752.1 EutN/CcmL family microcompartment protein [Frisingicoccus sp.]MDY4922580.1 EutN/CcmL family microcompartment protein [Frisingicoccus sp.]